MKPPASIVPLLLFGSGFCSLVYQTAWQKSLRLVFGASTTASAAVLGIFLGGLGLGAVLLGRRVERSRFPLTTYGNLELGISVAALLSLAAIPLVELVYFATGGSMVLGHTGATALRVVLSALVLGPATFLMGGTLPAAARAVVLADDHGRSSLARIYALNTLGAVAGALIGPLFAFAAIGTRTTMLLAVLLNLLVAMVARNLGRTLEVTDDEAEHATADEAGANKEGERDSAPRAERVTRRPPAAAVYFAAFVAGFGFLYLELVWYRVLAPLLGGSTITFGLILATALLGIGGGGLLYSLYAKKRTPGLAVLSISLALEAALALVPYALGDGLALYTAHLRGTANLGFSVLLLGWLFITAIFVLPAALVSGFQFPLLFALLGAGRKGVAREVGLTYGFNTIGTILGAILGGIVLLPALGALSSWKAAAFALCLAIPVSVALRPREHLAPARLLPLTLLLGMVLFFALGAGPTSVFRHAPIGAGRFPVAGKTPNQLEEARRLRTAWTEWEAEGIESSVAADVSDGVSFIVNGKSDGSIIEDRGSQIMLGLLPAALHPSPKSSFVVGFGTGTTAGVLGLVPEMTVVDVAELEPVTLEIARMSERANGGALANPKIEIHFGDAREVLLAAKRKYDIIVSEPSNPYRAGIANLFTREFYEKARAHLSPGGIFSQWIQGYEIDASAVATVIFTMREVFGDVSLFTTAEGDLVLIGREERTTIDMRALDARLSQAPFAEWLPLARFVTGAEGLMAERLATGAALDDLLDRVFHERNTDDRNVLELAVSRTVGQGGYDALPDILASVGHDPGTDLINLDRARFQEMQVRVFGPVALHAAPGTRAFATALGCRGNHEAALDEWPKGTPPVDVVEHWVFAFERSRLGDPEAAASAAFLERHGFSLEASLLEARIAFARGDAAQGASALERGIATLRKKALHLCTSSAELVREVRDLGQRERAHHLRAFELLERGPFAAFVQERERYSALIDLAYAEPNAPLCARAFRSRKVAPAYNAAFLRRRADCFAALGAPEARVAEEDLRAFASREPASFADLTRE